MQRIIDGTIYLPRTHKEGNNYFPVIGFYSSKVSDNYYITPASNTRSKARTRAINHIKAMKSTRAAK
jgi:hypothetical protein